jgi:hypothetical protein
VKSFQSWYLYKRFQQRYCVLAVGANDPLPTASQCHVAVVAVEEIIMRNRVRSAMMAVAAVGVVAAVAPGLAAGIAVPTTSPAAGQGVAEVQGFEVCNIEWTVSDGQTAMVEEVRFDIKRDNDAGNCGSASSVETANATVRVQLRSEGSNGDFAECTITGGAATCKTELGKSVAAENLQDVNIIAFDRT